MQPLFKNLFHPIHVLHQKIWTRGRVVTFTLQKITENLRYGDDWQLSICGKLSVKSSLYCRKSNIIVIFAYNFKIGCANKFQLFIFCAFHLNSDSHRKYFYCMLICSLKLADTPWFWFCNNEIFSIKQIFYIFLLI